MHRDRLPGNVRVEHLLFLWRIQAGQIGFRTHQCPIIICAADEDLPGYGQCLVISIYYINIYISIATVNGSA